MRWPIATGLSLPPSRGQQAVTHSWKPIMRLGHSYEEIRSPLLAPCLVASHPENVHISRLWMHFWARSRSLAAHFLLKLGALRCSCNMKFQQGPPKAKHNERPRLGSQLFRGGLVSCAPWAMAASTEPGRVSTANRKPTPAGIAQHFARKQSLKSRLPTSNCPSSGRPLGDWERARGERGS